MSENNAWAGLLKMGMEELEEYPIGQRVQLNFGVRCKGKIIEHDPPYGLLAPGYKVQWDDGEITPGFLKSSEITKIKD